MFIAAQFTQAMIVVGMALFLITLLIGIEVGIVLILVGSILIVSGFIGLWTDSYVVALVLASILSVFYVVYGRSLVKQKLVVRTQSTNIDKLIGQVAIVKKAVPAGGYGMVKLDDEEWRATSAQDLSVGTKVTVIALKGVTLEVEKK